MPSASVPRASLRVTYLDLVALSPCLAASVAGRTWEPSRDAPRFRLAGRRGAGGEEDRSTARGSAPRDTREEAEGGCSRGSPLALLAFVRAQRQPHSARPGMIRPLLIHALFATMILAAAASDRAGAQ